MNTSNDFIDGVEDYIKKTEEIQKRKDRLAEVRVAKQPGAESQFDSMLSNFFSRAWNDRRGGLLDEANNAEQRKEWLKAFGDEKPLIVGWYPSSSTDLRPVLISRTAIVRLPEANYQEPNLWIFSDSGGDRWSHFNEGTLFDEASTGVGGLIQKCWKLDPDLPFNGEGMKAMIERARLQKYSRLLRVALESSLGEAFATYILLLNADDSVVFEFLKNHGLPITHAVFTVGMVSPFLDSDDVFENLEMVGARWIFDQRRRCPQGWEAKGRILQCGNGGGDVNLIERVP